MNTHSNVAWPLSVVALCATAACATAACGVSPTDSDPSGGGDPSPGSGGSVDATGGIGGGDPGTGGSDDVGTGGAGTGGMEGKDVCSDASGTAPSGALAATQIMAANADSNMYFTLLEGPVWLDGALYYSHFNNETAAWPSRIRKYTPGAGVETFAEASGSNGLAVDGAGNLLAATHDEKEVSLFDVATKARTTLVGEYMGQPFNAPNDIVVADNGDVFFTDPDSDQKMAAPGGQDLARVYRWNGSELSVVDDSFKPNGIAITPDGSFLYVTGGGYSGKLRRYPLVDGVPGTGEDLLALTEPDGITFDCLGNLYATEHVASSNQSRVRVFNPENTEIATISVGPAAGIGFSDLEAKATNVTFGGQDGRTLYITATYSLWEIELDVAGLPY